MDSLITDLYWKEVRCVGMKFATGRETSGGGLELSQEWQMILAEGSISVPSSTPQYSSGQITSEIPKIPGILCPAETGVRAA